MNLVRDCAQAFSGWRQKDPEPHLAGEEQELPAVPAFPSLDAAVDDSLGLSLEDFLEGKKLQDQLDAADVERRRRVVALAGVMATTDGCTAADGGVAAVTSTQELRLAVEARLAHVARAKAEGERVIALITRHADYLISNPDLIPTDDLIQENMQHPVYCTTTSFSYSKRVRAANGTCTAQCVA